MKCVEFIDKKINPSCLSQFTKSLRRVGLNLLILLLAMYTLVYPAKSMLREISAKRKFRAVREFIVWSENLAFTKFQCNISMKKKNQFMSNLLQNSNLYAKFFHFILIFRNSQSRCFWRTQFRKILRYFEVFL